MVVKLYYLQLHMNTSIKLYQISDFFLHSLIKMTFGILVIGCFLFAVIPCVSSSNLFHSCLEQKEARLLLLHGDGDSWSWSFVYRKAL